MSKEKQFPTAAMTAVAMVERLNEEFPQLASGQTRQCVVDWKKLMTRPARQDAAGDSTRRPNPQDADPSPVGRRQQNTPDEAATPAAADDGALADYVRDVLRSKTLEDVLDLLESRTGSEWDYMGLIDLAGKEHYVESLRREGRELLSNAISPRQIADLWTELGRPAIGGLSWGEHNVRGLLSE